MQDHLWHDLIVIGASAGGLEALTALVAGLPPDLPGAVCVVLHRRPYTPNHLTGILSRAGPLPARSATQGAPLEPGVIYVAVPDQHLLVWPGAAHRPGDTGVIRLARGPKENRARPAVDPLFRSAALTYGPRVIAVVLSGALDDGTAGLWAVRDRGGIAVVQDPADAAVASMPASALAEVGADHVARAVDLGPLLGRLARLPVAPVGPPDSSASDEHMADLRREVAIAAIDEDAHERPERYGVPSRFPCPDCSGVLWDTSNGRGPLRLRCTVGHAYSPAALAEMQTEYVEQALWMALRALEDKAELARQRAADAADRGLKTLATRYHVQYEAAEAQAAALRAVLRLNGRSGIRDEDPPSDAAALTEHRAAARGTTQARSEREQESRDPRLPARGRE
jgi:two-component system chemotaxis response regulator CheB